MAFPEPAPRRREAKSEPASASARPAKPDLPADAVFSGELLRRLRESQGTSLQEIADRTKIGKPHLENIEADRFAALPAQVYLRGFLMALARELRLDPLRVSKSYLEQMGANAKQGAKPRS
jgi:cytoskeletal protein RodZ